MNRPSPFMLCLLAVVACAGTRTPADHARPDAPAPTTSPNPKAPQADLIHVGIHDGAVAVDGTQIAVAPVARFARVDQLFHILRSKPSQGATYRLSISGPIDVQQFKSVVQTAAFAGWPRAELESTAGPVVLRTLIAKPPESSDVPNWGAQTLVLVVRTNGVELWRAPNDAFDGAPSSTLLRTVDSRSLQAAVRDECSRSACRPALMFAEDAAPFSLTLATLAALSGAAKGTRAEVVFRVAPPDPAGPSTKLRLANVGRLRPEVIQRIVRESYGRLRHCYNTALTRDPTLEGLVSVRFVIQRDGRIRDAVSLEKTTLADTAAVECMLEEYRALVFPAPHGGVVSVIYPINFEPD